MKGKEKCDLLNGIRQKIADENNIDFHIEKCTFEGDCTGTCPKCESEREYLENKLEKKQKAGENVKLTNIFKNLMKRKALLKLSLWRWASRKFVGDIIKYLISIFTLKENDKYV